MKSNLERRTMKGRIVFAALYLALLCLAQPAFAAQSYDAQTASSWLQEFVNALSSIKPLNDPMRTTDPARAGQYLFEYEFGTVLARVGRDLTARDIMEIDVRNDQVTDCRGVRVGMELASALDGVMLPTSASQSLFVLQTQEAGYGWSWAYLSEQGPYGVEYITYGEDDAQMREYTLTYVIDAGQIRGIRMKTATATQAQAQDGLMTAEEIAASQGNQQRVMAYQNQVPALTIDDLTVMNLKALGAPVDGLVAVMGEPQEVQTLSQGKGRILLYDGAAVRLELEEMTGVEVVCGISVSNPTIEGPNGLTVGMSVSEAAALFRCDVDMGEAGGVLYYEEADEKGQLLLSENGMMTLQYVCKAAADTAVLEAGVQEDRVIYYNLYYLSDLSVAEDGE